MPSIPSTFRAPAETRNAPGCGSYSTQNRARNQAESVCSGCSSASFVSYDSQPAQKSIQRWQRQAKARRLIVAALTWPFRFVFGCRHSRTGLPYNNRQRCLDCGAARTYAFTEDGIFAGKWNHTTTVPAGRDGRSAILNPGADNPIFQPKSFAQVENSANGVMDRWMNSGVQG